MGQGIKYFDDITHRIDVRIGGLIIGVYTNTAVFRNFQSCIFGQGGFGSNADSHDYGLRRNDFAADQFNGIVPYFFYAILKDQRDSLIQHFFMKDLSHIVIKEG